MQCQLDVMKAKSAPKLAAATEELAQLIRAGSLSVDAATAPISSALRNDSAPFPQSTTISSLTSLRNVSLKFRSNQAGRTIECNSEGEIHLDGSKSHLGRRMFYAVRAEVR